MEQLTTDLRTNSPGGQGIGGGGGFAPTYSSTENRCSNGNIHRLFCEWRVIENFYTEHSSTHRSYGVYCIHCLKSKTVEIEIKTN